MSRGPSLLEVLHRLIERTYQMRSGLSGIDRFVLGDVGLARHYAASRIVHRVGSQGYPGAAVLVREDSGGVRAALYYPDALIAELERRNPLHGLDSTNLEAFAVFVEELDHLLTLADRLAAGRPASLFELELHAAVTKHLACRHFLERTLGRPLTRGERTWLQFRLFDALEPSPDLPEVEARYRDADRYGARFCLHLEALGASDRLRELRRFHHWSAAEAVRRIDAFSAS